MSCKKGTWASIIGQLLTLGIPAIVKAVKKRRAERKKKRGKK
jgi:hypothetical protein